MTRMHEIFAVLISILALCLSIYSVWQPHRTKRKKLVNAAYYHVKLAVERLQDMDQQIETAREKIRADKSYKMHIARSNTDDLTYDHVIELMEWLNPDQEKIISDYFHAQSAMHGVAESFDLAAAGAFSTDQQLRLLDIFAAVCGQTREYARAAEKFLERMKS
ncbi:MAG: hypothetical protein IBGAMO2_330016 [Arenicellales bacterium IbO2]|nr:MAG: hypothetical protein IBGAMO2_330016 [Arenicellales bacterium IbO2]